MDQLLGIGKGAHLTVDDLSVAHLNAKQPPVINDKPGRHTQFLEIEQVLAACLFEDLGAGLAHRLCPFGRGARGNIRQRHIEHTTAVKQFAGHYAKS